MTRLAALAALLALAAALPPAAALPLAAGVVRPPLSPPPLSVCTVDGLRLTTQAGRVRFATYGHRYPDNRLHVSQSYDRDGRLSGVSVSWSGFAGQIVNARASYDVRGQLVRETGFRRTGFSAPLRSYVKVLPVGAGC